MRLPAVLPVAMVSALLCAQEAGPLEGTVVNAVTQQPLRRADLVLRHLDAQPARGNALGALETDGEGRFQITRLPPGEYSLQAQRPGFHSRTIRLRTPLASGPLVIRLTPHSVIAGRVVDDEGEPAQGAQVAAIALQSDGKGRRRWNTTSVDTTNDRGEYRLWGLPAGRYFVRAQWRQSARLPRSGTAMRTWLPTYYPGAVSAEEASAVLASPGVESSGIEIALRRGSSYAVSGVVETLGGTVRGNLLITLLPKGGGESSYDQQSLVLPSTQAGFRFENVRPGSWMLHVSSFDNDPMQRGSAAVEVGAGDVTDVRVPLQPAAQVRGKAVLEGASRGAFPQVALFFDPEDPSQLSLPPARIDEDGSFRGQLAVPGRYRLRVQGAPAADAYLHAIRFGSQQVLGSFVDVAPGSIPPIALEFRPDGGRVLGSLTGAGEFDEYTAVLLAADEAVRAAIPIPDTAVHGGRFEFTGIRPGAYYVLAVPVEQRSWLDWPETLAGLPQLATRVEVPASGGAVQVEQKPVRLQP